jgi:DnaJ-domain-containing protein 1
VLTGPFRGRRLSELTPEELMAFLRECRVQDEESARVLEAYLDRTHGAGWRDADDAAGAEGAQGASGRRSPWSGASGMSREEACEILGVGPAASAREIKAAHRKLMLKLHPDHGGSDYLAAKINQAKDVLLGGKG